MKQENKVRAILLKPGRKPQLIRLANTLDAFQAAVGGYIEVLHVFDDNTRIIVDEEGKLKEKPINCVISNDWGGFDVLVGDLLIINTNDADFCSLTDEQARKYMDLLNGPALPARMAEAEV